MQQLPYQLGGQYVSFREKAAESRLAARFDEILDTTSLRRFGARRKTSSRFRFASEMFEKLREGTRDCLHIIEADEC